MPKTKVSADQNVKIPKSILSKYRLKEGDIFTIRIVSGSIILTPEKLKNGKKLQKKRNGYSNRNHSRREQLLLESAKKKIAAINRNLRTARGLTEAETKAAAQVGLIDPDQRWWWTEEWQKGERKAQRDIETGRVSKVYDDVGEALRALKGGV
ncbi:MAG: AbrB/MazE/SpoVT family DNA-binding domain-containing protein [bacterium]